MNRSVMSAVLAGVLLLTGTLVLYTRNRTASNPDNNLAIQQYHQKTAVVPEGSSPPIGPYTPAVRAGDMLFLSGQLGVNPATGNLVEGGTVPQARQAMANLRSLLNAAGMTFDNVVRATVYLADLDDYGTFNEEYGRYFDDVPPARVCIEVSRIPRDARVEISMIAIGGSN
jgi:2-iminobutanoate/2-iminopropanoate deaminase